MKLNAFFEESIEIPRMKVGQRQTIETLISEEALLFARYIRKEGRIGFLESALHIKRALASVKNVKRRAKNKPTKSGINIHSLIPARFHIY